MLEEIRIADERMKNSITEMRIIHIPRTVTSPVLQLVLFYNYLDC